MEGEASAAHRLFLRCLCRAGFFPSIKDTLNHIITVDWFYIDGL
ncbi:damage-inducible protein DinB, partial [Rhizobium brockwellii]